MNESFATQIPDLSPLTLLEQTLRTGSVTKQLKQLAAVADSGAAMLPVLQHYLQDWAASGSAPTPTEGRCYELLLAADDPRSQQFLTEFFPTGVVPLTSEQAMDYRPLQQLLARQSFQEADRITLELLCALAGEVAIKRKWLYFTEVDQLPTRDLLTVDQLWFVHSEGKFGFSVQRQLWLGVGKKWEALWPKIAWKSERTWTRYPDGFIWDLQSAPKGHLPLSNQLRGVQVFNALLSHRAWD